MARHLYYAWSDLLKEILETVEGRTVTQKDINDLNPQERNKLISENVVLSTLYFHKKIEKELKLMMNVPTVCLLTSTELSFSKEELPMPIVCYGLKTR